MPCDACARADGPEACCPEQWPLLVECSVLPKGLHTDPEEGCQVVSSKGLQLTPTHLQPGCPAGPGNPGDSAIWRYSDHTDCETK